MTRVQYQAAAKADLINAWLQIAADNMASGMIWHGPDPINDLRGVEAFVTQFWAPLQQSFRDLKRQTHIFFGGKSSGRIDGKNDGNMWVTGTGYLSGIFVNDYLSIPANNSEVNIRWGEFCRLRVLSSGGGQDCGGLLLAGSG